MGIVTAQRPHWTGVFGQPGVLAAGAAGCVAAVLTLWALRGLPLGTAFFWLSAFPIFAAGLAFGPAVAVVAGLLGTLLVAVSAGGLGALVFAALFGAPAPLLVAAALRGGQVTLSLPLALFGLWPVVVLLLAAAFLADDGGLEAKMRDAVQVALVQLGLPASDAMVTALVRVKAGAIGFWADLALLANARGAMLWVAKRGLLGAPLPDWSVVRLPAWYPLLPALALGLFLAAPDDADAVPLSALVLLLVPLFLQGLAGVHARLRGRKGRQPMLAAFYLLLVLFLQVMGPGLVGLGLYDQFQRRAAPRQS